VTYEASWHADGLRWIGSLFYAAANFLDRAPRETPPQPHGPAPPQSAEDCIDEVRFRVHMRGL
jgi:hypothetical protein